MTVDRQSHYTYGTLRDAIYKAMGDYSVNGKRVSVSMGAAADTDKAFLQALNMCMRRVCMSFPLLAETAACTFEVTDGAAYIALPENLFAVHSLTVSGKPVAAERYCVKNGRLFLADAKEGEPATLVYAFMPSPFDENTDWGAPVKLPDITCDALIYLTAAELCPSEEAERYARLLYGYRDIAYNVYNAVPSVKKRNTFFADLSPLRKIFCRTGR